MLERFETERLILRAIDESDIPELLNYYERNIHFFKPWLPRFSKDYYTADYQLGCINSRERLRKQGTDFGYYIFKKEDSKGIIGYIAISNIVRGVFQSGFLGYDVDENENGKGIATEAIKKVIEVSFNEINLHRLEANVIPANAASIRVLEKLNFIKEGFSKNYLKINNKWEDHLRFAVINENFKDD